MEDNRDQGSPSPIQVISLSAHFTFSRYLLDFQQKLPAVLSPAQKRQLVPMENVSLSPAPSSFLSFQLLVEILDLVPPIFTMTELYQFKNAIYLHAFPVSGRVLPLTCPPSSE